MKYYLLILLVAITGCKQVPDNKLHTYYSSPELVGMVFFNDQPIINAQVFLLTSCNDKQAITDMTGYFSLSPACAELIPYVPDNELGYFYQLIVVVGNQQFLWRISGLGYGFKMANVELDLVNRQVSYQVLDGVSTPYEGVDMLEDLNEQQQ